MRSRAALTVVVTAVLGVVALLIGAASDERPLQQVLGVFVQAPVAPLAAGHQGCQGPIGLVDTTGAVEFNPGTPQAEPGPAMSATVLAAGTEKVLARGRLAAGFDPGKPQTIKVSPAVPDGTVVDVCFRNDGPGRAILFGDSSVGKALLERAGVKGQHPTISTSAASIDGRPLPTSDIAVVFPRAEPKSALELVPEMFRRGALFRPAGVGPWTFWLLAFLVVVGAPLALWRALARTLAGDDD